jgi:nitroimidazol reductase NimA-like FMN-containing flavoprotein (pyridoxamine 5'-phosphate oxidase superfamily)
MDGQTLEPRTTSAGPSAQETSAMTVLDEAECWRLLALADVGRLAVHAAGDIDIFPVNFIVDGHTLVFRTSEGTKLLEVVLAGRVAFEADGYLAESGQAWSVVAKGDAELLEKFDDIYRAQELPIYPWHSGPKERFVRITVDKVTGRRFVVNPHPAE